MKLIKFTKQLLNFAKLHGLLHFYPNLPIFLHRYICHICDILQLCSVAALFCTLPSNLEIFDNLQVGLQKPKGRLYFKYKIANLDGKIYHIVKLQTIIILFNFKLDIMWYNVVMCSVFVVQKYYVNIVSQQTWPDICHLYSTEFFGSISFHIESA